jgi:hypothetical protein
MDALWMEPPCAEAPCAEPPWADAPPGAPAVGRGLLQVALLPWSARWGRPGRESRGRRGIL